MSYQQPPPPQSQTSYFPSDLPPRPNPHNPSNPAHAPYTTAPTTNKYRYCWAFSLSSFDPRTSDKAVLARRICMLTTLLTRTAVSIIMLIVYAINRQWVSLVIWTLLGILGFAFIAWCLAVVGECRGTRKVLGINITRWHWDVFLFVLALIHVGIIVGMWWAPASVTTSLWYGMWLVLALCSWIATWPPHQESQV